MLKLILADNQAIFRAGIAKVLAVEDEMRIVAQAQTSEQMFMALDKFRAAVLVIAGGFHSDFNAVLSAANFSAETSTPRSCTVKPFAPSNVPTRVLPIS